ncbi:CmeU family protein [Campylobacter geochelonis]|uniref:Chain length determinant protein n=1 Tax=Campylobacter geochelonis TaxID=1780362 RepID=A0A128EHN0_9BACT|nr:CmeU family protein [Campylobacter geochelonis]QKF70805.1 hypothetical protein CGEO_0476 [Campylobacter geochelonis]CZE47378.1 chain length determinant protein [Campylobacter geochelonis]CZE48097.1 chain length determinant protein [Campylobacter geochelonis]CZE50574.1 chain length determinant protein [Campylobacter geochelonis]
MQEKRAQIEQEIRNLLAARDEFFKFLDANVPKKANTDVFDFDKCKDKSLKEAYAKFYAYDYATRKLLPHIYSAYDLKFNV